MFASVSALAVTTIEESRGFFKREVSTMARTTINTRQLDIDLDGNYLLTHGVDALAIANVDVAAPGAAIGGVTMGAGMTALLTAQTDPTENGKWVFTGAATAMTRAEDMSISGHFRLGTKVYVENGDHEGETWDLTALSTTPFVLDTDEATFTQSAGGEASVRRYNMDAAEPRDGVEDTFTFGPDWNASVENVIVYLNGVRQHEGGANDYTISGTPEVVFNEPPPSGAKLVADFNTVLT